MSSFYQLDFERPIRELEERIQGLERRAAAGGPEIPALAGIEHDASADAADLDELVKRRDELLGELYSDLEPWSIVRVARHPKRPQTSDYVRRIVRDFLELKGDRRFGDDPAILTGFGRIGRHKCLVVGHRKGSTTEEKLACHFGCAHPEGYRKALSKMKRAEKFGVPIVTFVDTPGAYPGVGAEQRGQAEAIAVNMREMSRLRTPIISVVIGEGGSGGALGIAVADRVAMMRNAWYSVISPEGCAAILWKQANDETNRAAARALRLTAADNVEFGIVDDVIEEPLGGAHRDPDGAAQRLEAWIDQTLGELAQVPIDRLVDDRYHRFRRLGRFLEEAPVVPEPGETDTAADDGTPGSAEAHPGAAEPSAR